MNTRNTQLPIAVAALASALSTLSPASQAEAQINFENATTYESSLDEVPGMYAELQIRTCTTARTSDPGTKDAVILSIWSTENVLERYYLNGPQEDFQPGAKDVYQFRLPKAQLSKLKWFTLHTDGGDAWCIENVALLVNGGKVMHYIANDPLDNDTLHSSVAQSGKGPIILSKDKDEAPSHVVSFSDTTLGGSFIGLPLRRSEAWDAASEDLEAHTKNTTCSMPTSMSWNVFYNIVLTEIGDRMSNDEELYWGDGGFVNVGATDFGSTPVYHVKARFHHGSATVTASFDINISCGTDDKGNTGLHFAPTEPKLDVSLSLSQKILRGIADIFSVGVAEALIDLPDSSKPIDSKFTKTAVCPKISVDSDHILKMDWPEVIALDKLDLTQKQRDSIPEWLVTAGKGNILVPPNPLCIDMSTVKSIF